MLSCHGSSAGEWGGMPKVGGTAPYGAHHGTLFHHLAPTLPLTMYSASSFESTGLGSPTEIEVMTGTSLLSGQAGLPTANSTKSFWHRDPSKILLGHRTTPSLPTKADVVIIGSGISGAFAAHFLQEDARAEGLNIVMLEAREACWGATGRVSYPHSRLREDMVAHQRVLFISDNLEITS